MKKLISRALVGGLLLWNSVAGVHSFLNTIDRDISVRKSEEYYLSNLETSPSWVKPIGYTMHAVSTPGRFLGYGASELYRK